MIAPGAQLGPYEIVASLGAGGFGVVYRAHDGRLDRDVAIKVLPEGAMVNDDARQRFRHEALAAARTNHPNIGSIYDLGRDRDTDFIVMELVDGERLDQRIDRGRLEERDAAGIAAQIADALDALHETGVVHGDLKPGNVMLTSRGLVKLLDFGLSRVRVERGGGPADSRRDTATRQLTGTVPYISPEHVRGQPPDGRSDLYALGVILFEMLSGRRPHDGADLASQLYAIAHTPPPSLRSLADAVSQDMESLVA